MATFWAMVFLLSFPDGSMGGGIAGVYPTDTTCKAESQHAVETIMSRADELAPEELPAITLHCVSFQSRTTEMPGA